MGHPFKRNLDRDRGFQFEDDAAGMGGFSEALKRAAADIYEESGEGGVRSTPGTDIADPYGSQVKPKGVPAWDQAPLSPQEEAIYYGNHIHSESNPLGLHTHIKGGAASGGHSHGPQNRFGSHHHKDETPLHGITLDGTHTHDGANYPDGSHNHCPENFA